MVATSEVSVQIAWLQVLGVTLGMPGVVVQAWGTLLWQQLAWLLTEVLCLACHSLHAQTITDEYIPILFRAVIHAPWSLRIHRLL